MNAVIADSHNRGDSPRSLARVLAVFFILLLVTAGFAQGYVSDRFIVSGDAGATAANILAHRGLFMSAFSLYVVEMACNVVTVALGYLLLRPAGPRVAFVAVCLGLVGCTIKMAGRAFFVAPLFVLGRGQTFHAFAGPALNELAFVLLIVNDRAAGIAMSFFGFQALLDGWLTLRSTFLPKVLGVLAIVGGLGMLVFLWPPAVHRAYPIVMLLILISVVAKNFWLLVFGVNEARWYEQDRASRGLAQ